MTDRFPYDSEIAENLSNAIEYAITLGIEAANWLKAWSEGDEEAENQLNEWVKQQDDQWALRCANARLKRFEENAHD